MGFCPGRRSGNQQNCTSALYRRRACGNVGCDQGREDYCSNQAFVRGKCERCGKVGQKEMFK
jgi:hypothetical protein